MQRREKVFVQVYINTICMQSTLMYWICIKIHVTKNMKKKTSSVRLLHALKFSLFFFFSLNFQTKIYTQKCVAATWYAPSFVYFFFTFQDDVNCAPSCNEKSFMKAHCMFVGYNIVYIHDQSEHERRYCI